jgi:2'-5' RNA ligase
MLEHFITEARTIKSENRDFIEWHKGRARYAIWVLEIDDTSWRKNLQLSREYLQEYLLIGKHRAPHITLFACGFMDDQQMQAIQLQIKSLQSSGLQPFALSLLELNSFLSAAYISIGDPSGALAKLRTALGLKADDGRLEPYCPHLTVGLYKDNYPTNILAKKIKAFEMQSSAEIKINKVSLMSYAANNIFSRLQTEFQLAL